MSKKYQNKDKTFSERLRQKIKLGKLGKQRNENISNVITVSGRKEFFVKKTTKLWNNE